MFHIAYLVGSLISASYVLTEDDMKDKTGAGILYSLNLAHMIVPIFNFLISVVESYDMYIVSRVLETISIFFYQCTIFGAQQY